MAAAVAALVVASIAAIVVIARGQPAPAAAAPPSPLEDRSVAAADLAALSHPGAVELDLGGMRVLDADLARRLGLATNDRVTALSGRPLRSALSLHLALIDVSRSITTIYAEVTRERGHTLARWKLDGDLAAALESTSSGPFAIPSSVPQQVPPPPPDPVRDELIATIEKLDDDHYRVPRATIEKVLANPMLVARGVRVVPELENGRPAGFRLFGIRPSSWAAHIGLNNGDAIRTINGAAMVDLAQSLDVFQTLHTAKEVKIELVRRGAPRTLEIDVK